MLNERVTLFAGKWDLRCRVLVLLFSANKLKLWIGHDGEDYTEGSFSHDGEEYSELAVILGCIIVNLILSYLQSVIVYSKCPKT